MQPIEEIQQAGEKLGYKDADLRICERTTGIGV